MSEERIHVVMCPTCGMMPRFKGLQAYLKQRLGIVADFEYGEKGVFEVFYGEEQIYSKKQTGEFPSPPKVYEAIKAIQGDDKRPEGQKDGDAK